MVTEVAMTPFARAQQQLAREEAERQKEVLKAKAKRFAGLACAFGPCLAIAGPSRALLGWTVVGSVGCAAPDLLRGDRGGHGAALLWQVVVFGSMLRWYWPARLLAAAYGLYGLKACLFSNA
eukprot:1006955-Prymnesium_polylepis.1